MLENARSRRWCRLRRPGFPGFSSPWREVHTGTTRPWGADCAAKMQTLAAVRRNVRLEAISPEISRFDLVIVIGSTQGADVSFFLVGVENIGKRGAHRRGEQYRRRFNRERCVRGERQADIGRLAGQKLQECEHAPMPLLVAPTLANASAQAVHLPGIIDAEPLGSIVVDREQNPRLELQMPERPEVGHRGDAELPDMS